ncbi:uncharacterized protein KIAA0825 homolog isoform X3 [Dendrobates tinctorius]|uniref:uncharacterized protein KIAA0825 homolog isoform X3 n=1 Tax=Dendrobates tinctorius TaxID=92724 RepID=UPI003CC9494E
MVTVNKSPNTFVDMTAVCTDRLRPLSRLSLRHRDSGHITEANMEGAEDQLSFALLDCVLDMFPGRAECQQILNDLDEKLKVNAQSIEKCLENRQHEARSIGNADILPNNVDCFQWPRNTTSWRLYDTPHTEVMIFLKALQHYLKNCENQEDLILQFLMDLHSRCGITFPSSPSGSSFQCTSQTSLHAIDDDSSMDLQALWDDIRLHLRRHLVGKLQTSFDTCNSQPRINFKAQCLQRLLFLYPESDVLVKYQNIQQNFVVELLHDFSDRKIESVLGAYQKAIPRVYSMIKEDLFVLSSVIDSSSIIKFINETFFEAITEEMKTFFDILYESSTEERGLQPARLNKKRQKQRVHALALNTEDPQKKALDAPIQLSQLKYLSTFIDLFLWLEKKVEKTTSETLFLSCYPEIKGKVQGSRRMDANDDNTRENIILDESSLLMNEMLSLKFGWRNNLKELSVPLMNSISSELEMATTCFLQSGQAQLSETGKSQLDLVHISKTYECYGTISEKQKPRKVAKFCFDIMEEYDKLFPLALACTSDSVHDIRSHFVDAFSKTATSVLTRLEEWSSRVPDSAAVNTALVVLSSAVHVLYHALHYNEQMSKRPLFLAVIKRYQEFINDLQIHVTSYCVNVCATSLFMDAESHHWEDNKAFYEGERCSFSIQMWHYFCSGLRHDLWTIVPPFHGHKIFSEVLEHTLGLLTFRYAQIHPNYKRASQIRIDVLAILSCVENFLWSVCTSVEELVATTHNPHSTVYKIHNHCNSLLTTMSILSAPLEYLAQTIKKNLSELHSLSSDPASEDFLFWLTFINPNLFPSLSKTPSAEEMAVQGQLKLLLSQPCCNWNLLLETLLHPDCLIARTLLTCSITEVPEIHDFNLLILEDGDGKDINATETILWVFSHCSLSLQSFTALLENYMDQEQLWDSLCNQTVQICRNTVLVYLRRILIRSVRGLVNQVTSFIRSNEPINHSITDSRTHSFPDALLKALPEKWSFTNSRETKKIQKDIRRLTAEAVSIVISKLPSVIACLPPPIKYFYSFSERKLSEQYSVCKDSGIVVWNLIGIICHILEDGNAIEQMTGTTLSRWSNERLAAVCRCLEKTIGLKAMDLKDDTQSVLEDIERHRPKWIENQLRKGKVLSSVSDFAMQEDSSVLKDQGSRLDLTEQKINMMVLDVCHKPGGSEYLRQIHHIIQLNEDYLYEVLSSEHSVKNKTCSKAFKLSVATEDQLSTFNPFQKFLLPSGNVLSEQCTAMEESWDWSKLLPYCLRVNPVTLGELLLHRVLHCGIEAMYSGMRKMPFSSVYFMGRTCLFVL